MSSDRAQIHVPHLKNATFTGLHKGEKITIDEDWGYSFSFASLRKLRFPKESEKDLTDLVQYLVASTFDKPSRRTVDRAGAVMIYTRVKALGGGIYMQLIDTALTSQMERRNAVLWMKLCCERMKKGLASLGEEARYI